MGKYVLEKTEIYTIKILNDFFYKIDVLLVYFTRIYKAL